MGFAGDTEINPLLPPSDEEDYSVEVTDDATVEDDEDKEVMFDGANVAELVELGICLEAIDDKIIVKMDSYRSGYECKTCHGKGFIKSTYKTDPDKPCEDCHGKGALLAIPERAKSLPTSGIVISIGENTRAMMARRGEILLHSPAKIDVGARVIFGPHTGTLIPFKGNVQLKIMREHEPLAVMFGKDTGASDFIDYEVQQF